MPGAHPAAPMADWSQMPVDLLRLIARRLDTQFDVLRFRSVCSSWRSSVAPSPNPFGDGGLWISPHGRDPDDRLEVDFLSRSTIFLLGVPRSRDQTVPGGWLLKVGKDFPGRMHLLNPLSSCEFDRLPEDFPRVLDLMNLRVLELGHEYVLRCLNNDDRRPADILFPDKVAFMCLGNGNDYVLLRIASGKLSMFKSKEERWSIIQDTPSPWYDDVILFNGEFYAVDRAGMTVIVGLDSGVTSIVQPNFRGREKFLVESVGELLLVYRDRSLDAENDHESLIDYLTSETVQFKVYKLDSKEQVWSRAKDLGDRVLFLGDECAFSASAADLGASKGNLIFYRDYVGRAADLSLKMCVYDMDSGRFGPTEDHAGFSELFWPPPDWIASTTSEPAMAEWSQMPEDLLRRIARRLGTQFDVLRLRSVCSSWRSSLAPSPNPLRRGRIPTIPHEGYPDDCTELYLLPKRTIFLVGVPRSCDQTVPSGWLVKVWEDDRGGMNLLNPFTSCEFDRLPEDFPRVLDLMNLRVLELGHECVLQDSNCLSYGFYNKVWDTDRVVFLCLDNENDFALLRLIPGGTMVMFKSREKRWSRVQDMLSGYDDVILFKGEFYAVDNDGRTVVVGLDSSVTLIAQSTFDCWDKRLVESVGELLLVNMYWEEETTRLKVHKLDREEKVWNEVKDLGDRVLFLGEECTFSASAADLGACKGNCIFFTDHAGVVIGASSLEIGVYDMDSGIIGPIEDYAGYSQLFWPPPDWIVSRTAEPQVQNQLEALTV
ncbi:uncharacterized protein LOC104418994 [Eucalyptus grandis]|uniref:uncharacterized protein LOC104418994 n=1 Tax=Eucalyptus grandis TaxID=71139 RepID=UPI00192EC621|nr:uncharacterized protein LOC104418994 [Eucalyptus grandis]